MTWKEHFKRFEKELHEGKANDNSEVMWYLSQRRQFNQGTLSTERVDLLKAIDIGLLEEPLSKIVKNVCLSDYHNGNGNIHKLMKLDDSKIKDAIIKAHLDGVDTVEKFIQKFYVEDYKINESYTDNAKKYLKELGISEHDILYVYRKGNCPSKLHCDIYAAVKFSKDYTRVCSHVYGGYYVGANRDEVEGFLKKDIDFEGYLSNVNARSILSMRDIGYTYTEMGKKIKLTSNRCRQIERQGMHYIFVYLKRYKYFKEKGSYVWKNQEIQGQETELSALEGLETTKVPSKVIRRLYRQGLNTVGDTTDLSLEDLSENYKYIKSIKSYIDVLKENNLLPEDSRLSLSLNTPNDKDKFKQFLLDRGILQSKDKFVEYYYKHVNDREDLLKFLELKDEYTLLTRVYPNCPSREECIYLVASAFNLRDIKDISFDALLVFDKPYLIKRDKYFIKDTEVSLQALKDFVEGRLSILDLLCEDEIQLLKYRFIKGQGIYYISVHSNKEFFEVDGKKWYNSSNNVMAIINDALLKIKNKLQNY